MKAKKTTSPEAEQQKLWKLEMKQLEAGRTKISRDCARELRRSARAATAASRAAWAGELKHAKLMGKLVKTEKREGGKFERRIAFLKGRLGL